MTSGSQFRQWQREEARPIAARILTHSEEAATAWYAAQRVLAERLGLPEPRQTKRFTTLMEREHERLVAGMDPFAELRLEVNALRLIASPPTRQAAVNLAEAHRTTMFEITNAYSKEQLPEIMKRVNSLTKLEEALIATLHDDLGVPRNQNWLRRMRYRLRHWCHRPA
jgi:DNA-binding Lrp family transcriptional regulator